MKFMFRQMLAFLIIVMSALAISTWLVNDVAKRQFYNDIEMRLQSYGQTILDDRMTRDTIGAAVSFMEAEGLTIQFYLEDGTLYYPYFNQEKGFVLTVEEQELLAQRGSLPLKLKMLKYVPMATVFMSIPELERPNFPVGYMSVSIPVTNLEGRLREMNRSIVVSCGWVMLIAIIVALVYSGYQVRRFRMLQRAIQQISNGDYDIHVELSGNDEFTDLTQDFLGMANHLDEAQKEIRRQEDLRRQFMMDVAHEMRTPLTTMSGVIEGLQYDIIPEKQRPRSLELLAKETGRLTRLVNENLDYEKIRSNQISLIIRQLNGEELLQQVQQQLQERAEKKGNHILLNVTAPFRIDADYDRIIQILINLITNAIQFSENSEIVLTGYNEDNQAVIKIKDYGIGIDSSHIESIWERFYKVDISRKNTEFGESGIGLSVVKSLVEAHGGDIQVESELGAGAEFIVTLPLTKGGDDE